MTIDLEEPELTLLMSLVNVRICQLSKPETPLETNLMVKILHARNEAIKALNNPQI